MIEYTHTHMHNLLLFVGFPDSATDKYLYYKIILLKVTCKEHLEQPPLQMPLTQSKAHLQYQTTKHRGVMLKYGS